MGPPDGTFQLVDFGSRYVDIKGTDDGEARVRGEISDQDGDTFEDALVDGCISTGQT